MLRGIRFSNFELVPAIAMDGGSLRLVDCVFVNNSASALVITRGSVAIDRARFEHNRFISGSGGALQVHGGRAEVRSSLFRGNIAKNGGALFINNTEHLWLRHVDFSENTATERGGALFVVNSGVTLANQSSIDESNRAAGDGLGHSIYAEKAATEFVAVSYALPAPSGYWIANPVTCSLPPLQQPEECRPGVHAGYVVWSIASIVDQAVPILCAPGFLASEDDNKDTQMSPRCAGFCPPGSFCPGGLAGNLTCPRGHYCPAGVASGIACAAGTYNMLEGMSSAAACLPCTSGHYCSSGQSYPQACPRSTYNSLTGQGNSDSCKECPGVAITKGPASTRRDQCTCPVEFYDADNSVSGIRCESCVGGTNCTSIGSTLNALVVKPGYYRRTNLSIDVRRCPDAATGCSGDRQCPETKSGCLGGSDAADASCREGLSGVFCSLCASWLDESSQAHEFYVAATSSQAAHCAPCGQVLSNEAFATSLIALAGVAVLLIAAQLLPVAWRTRLQNWRQGFALYTLHVKYPDRVQTPVLQISCSHARPHDATESRLSSASTKL